ncbi:MAG: glycosyltransferase [Hydrogenophilales bacterium]|nr:glycosyltransferase [Hydrogenophilales bacterium]
MSETRRCIESALAAGQQTGFELIVIDDASPEPELRAWLDELRGRHGVTLLKNMENLGFVASANRGMALHPDRDVVLLNSDTEPANDWLDRLRRCAHAEKAIGTVTPFSNNATLCSFPWLCRDNAMPDGIALAELDACFSATHAGQFLDIPTAVGFCMYIKRACLEQVGLFDMQHFSRGYGEENDFSRRAAARGWRNVLCCDTFVYHQGGASFGEERHALMRSGAAALLALHPDYDALIQAHLHADPAAPYRRAVQSRLAILRRTKALATRPGISSGADEGIAQLHVLHDLGGGIAHWCRDFIDADSDRVNLVLKPVSHSHAFGEGVALYTDVDAPYPIWMRIFTEPIKATALHHDEYTAAIRDAIAEFKIGAIVVSSLIGHALDILDTGLPTVVVQHDFFPVCPAINAYYHGICQHCDSSRLVDCTAHNPDFNPFLTFLAGEREAVRKRYVDIVGGGAVPMVVPTDGVAEQLVRIAPGLAGATIVSIPHGYLDRYSRLLDSPVNADTGVRRLRIVVPGMLAVSKGLHLLQDSLEALTDFADIYLVGAKEVGELFRDQPGVYVVERYRPDELQAIMADIQPDLGLLMSICHETFSYTLSELFEFGIPPVATRVGSFAERISHGLNGFLFEPNAQAMLDCLRGLHANRAALRRVSAELGAWRHRSARDMVDDYHRLLPNPAAARLEWAESFRDIRPELGHVQAAELARFWRDTKSLHLSLQMKDIRLGRQAVKLENMRMSAEAREARTDALLARREHEIAEILASTSWRLSKPVRWLGTGLRKARTLWRCLKPLAQSPGKLPDALRLWWQAYRQSGRAGLKAAITDPAHAPAVAETPVVMDWRQQVWAAYQTRLGEALSGEFLSRVRAKSSLPLISILVPVYNTDESMLRAMLDSVLCQVYPNWELCIVDDGSTEARIRKLLKQYARRDRRIRLHFGKQNRGVSHASNQALAKAKGSFVVLLDHDDMLEPQALFRVAEAVADNDPDMLYSDEVLVGADGASVQHFIFRPMFSPEYLRSHPYIVHLVGFKTTLLRQLGGFDESLRISQDYDLILRASEQAGCIVHIPEILYRWRIHAGSAGHARIHEVMEVSKSVLRRHLQRCDQIGRVEDGASFNFFETRYPLADGLNVAIVIPTKNHAELVRTCIESIERTVNSVRYEIILIDHASDDPEAVAYFASLGGRVKLLRYSGPFNFSAINNWAVNQLADAYSHFLFCNNDVEALQDGWLERMLELGQKADVGIVGAKLYYPDQKTIQHAGVVVACCGVAENLGRFRETTREPLDLGYVGSLIASHEVSAVTGACMLIRKSVFDEIGGFDEGLVVGYGDVDLCLRTRERGYRVVFCPHAELLHHESYTRGRNPEDPHPEDSERFTAKWQDYYRLGDPYFNPNLSPHSPNWQVAQPLELRLDIQRRVFHAPAPVGAGSASMRLAVPPAV